MVFTFFRAGGKKRRRGILIKSDGWNEYLFA